MGRGTLPAAPQYLIGLTTMPPEFQPDSSRENPTRPWVGVAVVLLRPVLPASCAVLLIKRATPPALGAWHLPGGAQGLGETAETAARRELREETAISLSGPLRLAGHADVIIPAGSAAPRYHYTLLHFCALCPGQDARAGGDAASCAWVDYENLDAYGVTADTKRAIDSSRVMLGI